MYAPNERKQQLFLKNERSPELPLIYVVILLRGTLDVHRYSLFSFGISFHLVSQNILRRLKEKMEMMETVVSLKHVK